MERKLAASFAAILGRNLADRNLSFRALGINSLVLLRVFATLPEELKPHLALGDFFLYPNLEELATAVETRMASRAPVVAESPSQSPRERMGRTMKMRRARLNNLREGG